MDEELAVHPDARDDLVAEPTHDVEEHDPGLRPARLALAGVCAVVIVFQLWDARHQYFVWDEWSFWNERLPLLEAGEHAAFVNRPHIGHWHGTVMMTWGVLTPLFGARSYLGYLVPTLLLQAALAWAMFELLVVHRVGTRVALVTASFSLVLGAAAGNASFGWQVCFVLPLVAICGGLLFVERPSPAGNVAIVALVSLAVMSSNVGLTSLIVVAVGAGVRRRWSVLAGLSIPAFLAVVWRWHYDPTSSPIEPSLWRQYASYVADGLGATGRGIVQVDVALVAWAAMLGAVAVGVWRARTAPLFVLMAAGAVWFYTTLATQRSGNIESFAPDAARYVHVASILLLPCFALMADTVLRWRRETTVAVAVVAGAMLVGNAVEHARWNDSYVEASREVRRQVEATVALGSAIDDVPSDVAPFPPEAFGFTVGRLRVMRDDGLLPCRTDRPELSAEMAARLGVVPPDALRC